MIETIVEKLETIFLICFGICAIPVLIAYAIALLIAIYKLSEIVFYIIFPPKPKEISYMDVLDMSLRYISSQQENAPSNPCSFEEKLEYIFSSIYEIKPEFIFLTKEQQNLILINTLSLELYADETKGYCSLFTVSAWNKKDISFNEFSLMFSAIWDAIEKEKILWEVLSNVNYGASTIEHYLLLLYPNLAIVDKGYRNLIIVNIYTLAKYELLHTHWQREFPFE